MTLSVTGLTLLIYCALALAALAPLVLLYLWIKDRNKDTLW